MADVAERLDGIEGRLTSVEESVQQVRGEVGELRGEVGELRGEVGELRGEVGELRGKVGGLSGDVQKLRVLEEENAREIKLLKETHGARFDAIDKALEPLARLDDFVRRVASDREARIQELEKRRAGVSE
jgi:chromosome segregation ATPase